MADNNNATRLDVTLVERGLVATRSRARDLIRRGFVMVDGHQARKPADLIAPSVPVTLSDETPRHVSRGGEKLAAALDHFAFPVSGRTALDIGASTGGFSEVLLAAGAERVYAVDVGRGQLHPTLRARHVVINLEATDARTLTSAMIPHPVAAITLDVSFISLQKVLPPVLALAAPGAWLVALVKPQFEVGPALVAKNGVVIDRTAQRESVAAVRNWLEAEAGWSVDDVIESPILGASGNREFLLGARRHD